MLLAGYAPWPSSWHSHLPRQFAATLRDICPFIAAALIPDPDPAIDAGVAPGADVMPDDEALKPVTEAVRPVLSVLGRGRSRPGQVRS